MEQDGVRCLWHAKGEKRCPHPRVEGDAEYCVWHRKHAELIAAFSDRRVEDRPR